MKKPGIGPLTEPARPVKALYQATKTLLSLPG